MFVYATAAELLAPLLAGLAVALIIVFLMTGEVQVGKTLKKRISHIGMDHTDLKSVFARKQSGEIDDRTYEMMRKIVAKFKMESVLEDHSIKTLLSTAGLRTKKHMVIFAFARLASPPAMALLAYVMLILYHADRFSIIKHGLIIILAGLLGILLPKQHVKGLANARKSDVSLFLPDLLDLMVICVESGMSVEASFIKVAEEISAQSPILASEVSLTNAELAYLGDRRQAYENFAIRTGSEGIKMLTSALIQAEKYGTPVGTALRTVSKESRAERSSRAEQKAAALPAKLTVPMMLFFLPVLFIVVGVPAFIQTMDNLK